MIKIIFSFFLSLFLSACSLNINFNPSSVTPSPQPTQPISTPVQTTAPVASIEDQLTQFFATKFSKPIADAILTVSQNTGTHASGGIKFAGEIAGGMWLAHLDGDTWLVDYDGNGTIPCADVEPHHYPTSILTECWDESTQTVKNL